MNKYKLFMIVSLGILILSIGGSLAWYVWVSSNTNVSFNVCAPQISFIGGTTLNGNGLIPVSSRDKGLKKQIDVYLNKTCKEEDSAVMNLYLTIDLLPEGLRHETFIFEVVKDNEVLYSGNFKDKTEGQTITLLENEIITENDSIYLVYVYIDGTRDNPIEMSNQKFKFNIHGEGTGAIYKENVIAQPSTPSSSSSTFLNTSVTRNTIQTITIAKDNNVPEESKDTAIDISSKGDGSVMLWYLDDNNDGLLDIYMGSENGIITTNTNGQGMFAYLENIESLDLTNLDTSNITNMSSMFKGSSSLKDIKLGNFNTSNVTSMNGMFYGCNSLTELNLNNFNTSDVKDMRDMFYGCSSLTTLNLNSFNTSNVKNMFGMFQNCSSLTTLDLSNFDTSNVTDMSRTFSSCSSLISLNLNNWNTERVTDTSSMFNSCSSLTTLDLSDFETSNVTNMNYMFSYCSNLTSLDLSSFKIPNVTNMEGMFSYSRNLMNLNLRNADFSSVTNYNNMLIGIHTTATIYVKDNIQKEWITSRFSGLTNVIYS